jgi:PAP2 superfamily
LQKNNHSTIKIKNKTKIKLMKKIALFALSIVLIASSCRKENQPPIEAELKNHGSELVRDWIGLQLKVIKNSSGIQHIAYSRHFSYTGIALYESLVSGNNHYKSIAAKLNGSVQLPVPPQGKPLYWPASANAAVADMLRFFYSAKTANIQSIDSLEQVYINKYKAEVKKPGELEDAILFGKQVAAAVIELSKQDGSANANIPYTILGEGYWEPTAPAFSAPSLPGWGNNAPILNGSIVNSLPSAPLTFSKEAGSPFFNMVKEVYDVSQSLTDEQKAIANFWDDAPNGKYVTVFGHWFSILKQALEKDQINLLTAANAYMRLGITLNEATISCWKAKYTYNQLRPITYIRKHMGYTNWNALIVTPAHPEYSAAHATLSASAGYALESVLGKNYGFVDHTYDEIGMNPRTFTSFEVAAWEAGMSRLYGGIHYRKSIETGNTQGKKVGENVQNILKH